VKQNSWQKHHSFSLNFIIFSEVMHCQPFSKGLLLSSAQFLSHWSNVESVKGLVIEEELQGRD
jgi:hypothetical protein